MEQSGNVRIITFTAGEFRDVENAKPIAGRTTNSAELRNALAILSGITPELHARVRAVSAPSIDKTALLLDNDVQVFMGSAEDLGKKDQLVREILAKQKLPTRLVGKRIWKERFEDINAVERYLARNGIAVRKFFLHISKGEQRKRFLKRLEDRTRNWKFSATDMQERKYWNAYMSAYEDMIQHTATPQAPWYVIPADNKWFARLTVASAVVDTLEELKLNFPKVSAAERKELAAQRALLEGKSK